MSQVSADRIISAGTATTAVALFSRRGAGWESGAGPAMAAKHSPLSLASGKNCPVNYPATADVTYMMRDERGCTGGSKFGCVLYCNYSSSNSNPGTIPGTTTLYTYCIVLRKALLLSWELFWYTKPNSRATCARKHVALAGRKKTLQEERNTRVRTIACSTGLLHENAALCSPILLASADEAANLNSGD